MVGLSQILWFNGMLEIETINQWHGGPQTFFKGKANFCHFGQQNS